MGVTILALLQLISAIVLLASGAMMVFVSGSTGIFGIIFVIVGGIILLIGLIELIIFYGLWVGAKWAWYIAMIFSILGLLFNLVGTVGGSLFSIVGLVLAIVILYYLYQAPVKAYFGK